MPRLLARTTPARCTLTLKFEDFASVGHPGRSCVRPRFIDGLNVTAVLGAKPSAFAGSLSVCAESGAALALPVKWGRIVSHASEPFDVS
eukprot:3580645-Pleurochrysis_carterae.AAC.1